MSCCIGAVNLSKPMDLDHLTASATVNGCSWTGNFRLCKIGLGLPVVAAVDGFVGPLEKAVLAVLHNWPTGADWIQIREAILGDTDAVMSSST